MVLPRQILPPKIRTFLKERVFFVGPCLPAGSDGRDISPEDPVFFIDGGQLHSHRFPYHRRHPHPAVLRLGDGDSSKGKKLDLATDPVDKDFSDLSWGLSLLPARVKWIYLRGFLGGRKDHEWSNLGEAARFLARRRGGRIFFDRRITFFSPGEYAFQLRGQFSLLAFTAGARYRLLGESQYGPKRFTSLSLLSSRGLSNRGKGKLILQLKQGVLALFHPAPTIHL